MKNNLCLFERPFKLQKNGVFLLQISFFVLEILTFSSFKNTASIFQEISFIQYFPLFSCKQYDVITDLICIIEKRQYL